MKKLLIIPLLVIILCVDLYSQSNLNYGRLTFSKSSQTPPAGVNLNAVQKLGDALMAKYEANRKDYYDFANSIVMNLGPDVNSINYKAQNKALVNFKNTMKSYVQEDNWFDADSDLLKAKSQYYLDFQNYISENKSFKNDAIESAISYLNKGNNALNSENYLIAISNFNEALKLDPDLKEVYLGRSFAYASSNELDKALKDISVYTISFPDEPKGHLLMARIHAAKKNFEKSTMEYEKVIEINGNEYSLFDERGWIYIEMGKYMEAMKDFNKVVALQPQMVNGYFGRSRVKSELNDNIGEINDLKKVLEISPEHSMANNNLGWSYFMKGNTKEALDLVNKAILYGPDNYVAYDSRGEIKLKLGDYKGTINDSSKAIEFNPNLSNSYYIRAQAKYKLGDKTGACEDLSKSGELGNEKAYILMKTYCK